MAIHVNDVTLRTRDLHHSTGASPLIWEHCAMASGAPTIWEILEECVRSLDEPFRRSEIIGWCRRHYPAVNEQSLAAHIQGATSNASDASRGTFVSRKPLVTRVDHGVYRKFRTSSKSPELGSAQPRPVPSEASHQEGPRFPPRVPVTTGLGVPAVTREGSAQQEWSWEGNVQSAIVAFLVESGWSVTRVANTSSREPGTDVEASRSGERVHIEVKGWPSAQYVDPARQHEKKRTQPATQARVWFSDAIVHALRLRASHPEDIVAVALPAIDTYRRLWAGIKRPVSSVGIALLLVEPNGSVSAEDWPATVA